MAEVILMKGAVVYPLTIDPSVWIFDERKIDLHTYSGDEEDFASNPAAAYLKGTGAQWDKEMAEGATPPSERISLVEERKALEGDYAMRLSSFIDNAKPLPNVSHMVIHRDQAESVTLTLAEANQAILQFAKSGKPIRENGPVLLYLPAMWKEKQAPIDRITVFEFVAEK